MSDSITQAFLDHAAWRLQYDYLPKANDCAGRFTEDAFWWRPHSGLNSMGNLTLHLCGNLRQWILHGLAGYADIRERNLEFADEGSLPKDEVMTRLNEITERVAEVIRQQSPETLLEPRQIQGYPVNGLLAVFHVTEHFAQHLGQMIYITKLRTGEDLQYFKLDENGYYAPESSGGMSPSDRGL